MTQEQINQLIRLRDAYTAIRLSAGNGLDACSDTMTISEKISSAKSALADDQTTALIMRCLEYMDAINVAVADAQKIVDEIKAVKP